MTEKHSLMDASARIALAAYLHDLGKLAERARLEVSQDDLDTHVQMYCPRHEKAGKQWYTHKHAAYTALAFNVIEEHLPALKGADFFPFASCSSRDADDSLVNAAAKHHKPENFLQWVIATADRVASGFERDSFEQYNNSEDKTETGRNHYQARQLSLLEAIRIHNDDNKILSGKDLKYRQPLRSLTPENLFPQPREQAECDDDKKAQQEYRDIWNTFLKDLELIPESHRYNLALWLDHFDTLWRIHTHAIPSATAFNVKPDVSLYDHSRTTAALATALWRYHHERDHDRNAAAANMKSGSDWSEEKFLLVQGDFFGIQNFIFAGDSDASHKNAARLLRGRSLYVSLLAEAAALKVLDALDLPATSQILNAAGKFLIVAPNTPATIEALQQTQKHINAWFLEHTYAQSGLGLAWIPASCQQFVSRKGQGGFRDLIKALFASLERAKYQSFDLLGENAPSPVFTNYLAQVGEAGGLCQYTGWGPGTHPDKDGDKRISTLAKDQIQIGDFISGKRERLAITRHPLSTDNNSLRLPIFGYHLHFTNNEEATGRFGREASNGNLRRLIDFSLADSTIPTAWHGYARRNINGYVPIFNQEDINNNWRYADIKEEESSKLGALKTLNHLACEDLRLNPESQDQKKVIGIQALGILKGDVDNLGAIFQKGLEDPTFARMAGLSRQMDSFFSSYLPWLCQQKYPNTYTVFAGGDDFFLIGPWYSLIRLALELRAQFQNYCANNPDLHFSAGIALAKPGLPIPQLARMTEDALEKAKKNKNSVHLLGETLSWQALEELLAASDNLQKQARDLKLSTGFIYSLLELSNMAADTKNPESALWRSRLNYRLWRHLQRRDVIDKLNIDPREAHRELMLAIGANGIAKHGKNYRVAVTTHLYLNRNL